MDCDLGLWNVGWSEGNAYEAITGIIANVRAISDEN